MLGSAMRMFTARLRRLRALECFRFGPIDAICYFPNSVRCCAARLDEVGDGKATLTYSSLASGFHRGEVCAT